MGQAHNVSVFSYAASLSSRILMGPVCICMCMRVLADSKGCGGVLSMRGPEPRNIMWWPRQQ